MHRVGCLLLALSVVACKGPPSGTSLFPLDAGRRWTYDVVTEREGGEREHDVLQLTALGEERLADGAAWRRRSESGVDYWLRADESGVYRVASKSDLDDEPRPDKERRYVLKTPLAVGSSWQASTTAYLLQRRQEFPREIRHSHPVIPMNYTISALGETVETRAGRFEGCVRVTGNAVLVLFADPVSGWTNMPLATNEWYCPGVGLVKLERREPASSAFLTGGTQTMELIAWQ
jgi:hypothetical protein